MISFDAGRTWQNRVLSSSLPNLSITAITANESAAFVGTTQGVFVSRDSGKTWHQENNGLVNQRITALALTGTMLFAGTEAGMFHTALMQTGTGVPLGFEKLGCAVFPNPALSALTVTARLNAASVLRLSIINAHGNVVINRQESINAGEYRADVDVIYLPVGTYFVRIEAGTAAWIEKIVKH